MIMAVQWMRLSAEQVTNSPTSGTSVFLSICKCHKQGDILSRLPVCPLQELQTRRSIFMKAGVRFMTQKVTRDIRFLAYV
jgi:hypothetical protein